MKKTIILCTGNFILFLLIGLAFLYPAQQVQPLHPGVSAQVGLRTLTLTSVARWCRLARALITLWCQSLQCTTPWAG